MAPRVRAIAIILAVAAVGCIEPRDRRPGLWLHGESVTATPSDWSFSEDHQEIFLEVQTPYFVPHSVTIWCGNVGERLFVAARDPDSKRWPAWADSDPNVRLRIGEQIFEVRLDPLEDPSDVESVRRAYARKYELADPPPDGSPPVRYWAVARRS